jgi:hypothetical protein
MAHYNTVLNQMANFLPRHEFESLARRHTLRQRAGQASRWTQFMSLSAAQLAGWGSLRDITDTLKTQGKRLYHLGMTTISRSTLSRMNQHQPATLYEKMFGAMLQKCQEKAPQHGFSFKSKLYLMDATVIDLCLASFPWATFRQKKGGVKLHIGLDADGCIPAFLDLTDAKEHDIVKARERSYAKGDFLCFDRGYCDYEWWNKLDISGTYFVTRLKKNAGVELLRQRVGRKSAGVSDDVTIRLNGVKNPLRLVEYTNPEDGHVYHFVTNAHHIKAKEIADIYKKRWTIENFFKWIKQHLKIKTFLGTSRNAVLTQVWITLIVYLLLSYLKFLAKIGIPTYRMLRRIQASLFLNVDLFALFKPPDAQPIVSKQLLLF